MSLQDNSPEALFDAEQEAENGANAAQTPDTPPQDPAEAAALLNDPQIFSPGNGD